MVSNVTCISKILISKLDKKNCKATRISDARISAVDSVMFVNRMREIVSFELGEETEKDVFRLVAHVRSCHI